MGLQFFFSYFSFAEAHGQSRKHSLCLNNTQRLTIGLDKPPPKTRHSNQHGTRKGRKKRKENRKNRNRGTPREESNSFEQCVLSSNGRKHARHATNVATSQPRAHSHAQHGLERAIDAIKAPGWSRDGVLHAMPACTARAESETPVAASYRLENK